jgi:hypothetical protein
VVEKGGRRVNMVQMIPVETIPGMEGGIKESSGGGEF